MTDKTLDYDECTADEPLCSCGRDWHDIPSDMIGIHSRHNLNATELREDKYGYEQVGAL